MSSSSSVPRVAILAAAFNEQIVGPMIAAAEEEVRARGGEVVAVVRVPGAYELVLPARMLLRRAETDLLVVLGYIERGETQHGEVMGHVVHRSLVDLSLEAGRPVGLGLIGPGANAEQAEQRKLAYARAAVSAGLAQLATLRELEKGQERPGVGFAVRAV